MAKKNLKQFSIDFKRQVKSIETFMKKDLHRIVKREALNHFEGSWDKQGFTDTTLKKWAPRTEPAKKFKKSGGKLKSYQRWKAKDKGRAILVSHRTDTKGGHLKDSLRGEIRGSKVIIATDKVYARVHNEGGRAGRGKGFTMKKRQFIGDSEKLNQRIINKIDKQIDKIFQS